MSVPKTFRFNNGEKIPTVGLGTYESQPRQVEQAVKTAIDLGYRHFDCAWFYGNEAEVGNAIREKISTGVVKREELFVTSKLWNNFHARNAVVPKMKESFDALKLDYLDLYLIHWPFAVKEDSPLIPHEILPEAFSDIDYLETWQGMEDAHKTGLVKSIGVSNFNSQQIDRLLKNATIKPVVNQVECNPNLNQKKLAQFCKEKEIVVVGYCPLGKNESAGKPDFPESTILDPKVAEIGKKYNKTPAQVVLNYMVVNLGVVPIPKSVTPSRIKENIDIYDFVLDPNDVAYLDSCNKNARLCPFTNLKHHKYYSFNAEF